MTPELRDKTKGKEWVPETGSERFSDPSETDLGSLLEGYQKFGVLYLPKQNIVPTAPLPNYLTVYAVDVGGATTLEAVNSAGALYKITHPPTVHVTRSNTQTITSAGGLTAASWDTEGWDSDAMWSVGVPTKLIAPIDGIYRIWGTVDWATPDAGSRQLTRIRKDGATVLDSTEDASTSSTGAFQSQKVYAEYPLLATNYVELMVQITVDASTTINANSLSHFGMTWVRPIV